MKKYPIILKPHTEHPIWSGKKLKEEYGVQADKDIGEAFNMSTLVGRESVAVNGDLAGLTLSEILRKNRDFVKESSVDSDGRLSLLFKLIDTSDMLSVQVHPNNEYALKRENQLGKTEAWYILSSQEDSFIYLGLNDDYDRQTIKKAIENNTIEKYLTKCNVKEGDYFYLPSGTIHALGKGITICEIQQSSMVTYRLYDYDRKDKEGKPRELHIEKSLDVINYNKVDLSSLKKVTPITLNELCPLDKRSYFENLTANITKNLTYAYQDYTLITVTYGNGTIQYEEQIWKIVKGNSIFIPKDITVTLSGTMSLYFNRISF